MIVDFERSGTVVWFFVASRFGWLDISCVRDCCSNKELVASPLPNTLPERESGYPPSRGILESYASFATDLINHVNPKVPHSPKASLSFQRLEVLFQKEHTQIHRMLFAKSSTTAEADLSSHILL